MQNIIFVDVGEDHVYTHLQAVGIGTVEHCRHGVKKAGQGSFLQQTGSGGQIDAGLAWRAVAELVSGCQVNVPPGPGLCLVAELVVVACQQRFGRCVFGLSEYQVIQNFGYPAVFTDIKRLLGLGQNLLRPAHQPHITLCRFYRGNGIQMRRVGVVPTKISLVNCPGVMAHGTVITPAGKTIAQGLWHPQLFRDFSGRMSQRRQTHCLIVDVLVGIALLLHVRGNLRIAPQRPVMAREEDLRVGKQCQCFVNVGTPLQRIAHFSAAQGVEVMHVSAHDLSAAKGFQFR